MQTALWKMFLQNKVYLGSFFCVVFNISLIYLPHPWRGDSKDQKTFLAPSAGKQIRNYNIECSNHYPSLSTLSSKGLSRSKMKWWAINTSLPVNAIVRLPHPRSRDCQSKKTFLALSADKQTRNCDTECSNHYPSLSTLRSKRLSRSKMKWWAIYTNLPVDVIVRLPHSWSGNSQGQETFLAPSADKQTRNYDIYLYIYWTNNIHIYTTSVPAHLFAIRGRRKRGPGTL